MFRNHPKGLFIVFLVSLFERMAYYVLFAILVLSLQTGYGIGRETPGIIYAFFLFGVFSLGIAGGYLADKKLGYSRSCFIGMILMLLGYVSLSIPGNNIIFICSSLFILAVGNGFYKSNMVALLGNFYEPEQYRSQRDAGFNIFYMGINAGAMIAPFLAFYAGKYIMSLQHFTYNVKLHELAGRFIGNNLPDTSELVSLIKLQASAVPSDITSFCNAYLDSISNGYHAAYAIAAVAMVFSIASFIFFRKYFKNHDIKKTEAQHENQATSANDRERVQVLIIVMLVVMFFWMSFFQNGYSLTLFANNYTADKVAPATYLFFDFLSVLLIIPVLSTLFLLFLNIKKYLKILAAFISAICIAGLIYRYNNFDSLTTIKAEIYQYFNPFFCILLTPLVLIFFAYLKDKEPSTPKKIGIGMLITAVSYSIIMFGSLGLQSPKALGGHISPDLISPWWLINVYLTTTLAELFLNPIGMSFVSKVAPGHLKGVMQGAWFGAMAAGNLLSGLVGTLLWNHLELWQFFAVFVITSLISAGFIFALIKRLERVSG